jgi:hypothetical protein
MVQVRWTLEVLEFYPSVYKLHPDFGDFATFSCKKAYTPESKIYWHLNINFF